MKLHTYQTERFAEEGVQTEATAYRLLTQSPLDADVNYLAAPWSILLRTGEHVNVDLRIDGGFTICQHCYFRDIIPVCIKIGLDTLFASHVENDWAGMRSWRLSLASQVPILKRRYRDQHRRLREFRVLPFPHLAVNGAQPSSKDLWYSYIGTTTHPVRKVILQLQPRPDTIIQERDRWHFDVDDAERARQKDEYQDVIARSRFSICPRGFGPSTIRFWESLQAGAIPVLVADSMSLPGHFDWDSAIVRVPENRASHLESILQGISPQQEDKLRENCLAAAGLFLADNLPSSVRHVYDPPRRAA